MKYLIVAVIMLGGIHAVAETKASEIKSWKTFHSGVGYELKYPGCWNVQIGDVNDTEPIGVAKEIFIGETVKCTDHKLASEVPRGLAISDGWGARKTIAEAAKEIEIKEKRSANEIARKDELIFKKLKIGSNSAIAWVEFLPGVGFQEIRWNVQIFCPDWWISTSGPMIRNPDKSYYEKFKAGDLALPEPEKTIIESIRCIPSKPKEPVKKSDTLSSSKNGKK